MGIRILIIISAFFLNNVLAKDVAIYRWVDENNVVHFSQNQPTSKGYSQLTTFSSYRANKPKNEMVNDEELEAEKLATEFDLKQKEIQIKNKEIFKKNCSAAKLNIKMLNSFKKVLYTDPDGKSRILTDKDKQEQLDLSEKHIELYCDKASS